MLTLLANQLGSIPRLSFYYLAVVLAGWYGGRGPGLLAALLCIIAGMLTVFPPLGSLPAETPADLVALGAFALTAILVTLVMGFLHQTRRQALDERAAAVALADRLAEAQQLAHVGSWEWAIATNVVKWSDELYRVYGHAPGEVPITYEGFLARVHPDDREQASAAVARTFQEHVSLDFEHRIIRPDGSVRTLHARGEVVLGPDGTPVRMVGTGQDITERKQAEQQAHELLRVRAARADAERGRQAAETANRARSDFLAAVSHDLRTPLNAIAGYSQILELGVHGALNDKQRDIVSRIQRNQTRLLQLIENLLSFVKLEAGRLDYNISSVSVDQQLRELDILIGPEVQRKRLHYEYHPCDPDLHARADAAKLEQVLLNLLSNAVKFTEPGGWITVACDVDDDRIRIRVRDTGPGIPADKLESIFEPFVQADAPPRGERGGSGLGLAISRDLARGMAGDVVAESVLGKGSTFTLSLPRVNSKVVTAAV